MEDEEKTRAARLSVSRFWHEHNHVHATADNGLQRSYQSSTTELGHLGWFGLTSGVQTVSLCVRLQCCFVPWDKINQRKEKTRETREKNHFRFGNVPHLGFPVKNESSVQKGTRFLSVFDPLYACRFRVNRTNPFDHRTFGSQRPPDLVYCYLFIATTTTNHRLPRCIFKRKFGPLK